MSLLLPFLLLAGSTTTFALHEAWRLLPCQPNQGIEPNTAGWYHDAVGSLNLNLRPNTVSMSGHSSGGMMTHQFHLAHSSSLIGVGIYSGAPYRAFHVARGLWLGTTGLSPVRLTPRANNPETNLAQATNDMQAGKLDSFSNLDGQKVYIYHGGEDGIIGYQHGKNLVQFYQDLATNNSINIDLDTTMDETTGVGHGIPSKYSSNADCDLDDVCIASSLSPFRHCSYSVAEQMFEHIYGPNPGTPSISGGTLYKFNQKPWLYVPKWWEFRAETHSMADEARIFVPNRCKQEACHFHVAMHGCINSETWPGEHLYYDRVEYKELAINYGIVVLFPQAKSTLPQNTLTCWNMDGYPIGLLFKSLNYKFPTKQGEQITALKGMMDAVLTNNF